VTDLHAIPGGCDDDELLSTAEAAIRSGASYRQLDYWTRTGLVSPAVDSPGSGTPRRWSPGQIPTLTALAAISTMFDGRPPSDLMRTVADQPGPIWEIRIRPWARITIEIDHDPR
jgi:hypothetical protein